jgi:uncharacterized membrane protein YphA (DoxX/SURF4 family)
MGRGSGRSGGLLEATGRLLLSGIFVHGGWNAFKDPGKRPLQAARLGLPEPELLVRANGAAMAAGGAALALGIMPRATAAGLIASLVPTTLAGHRFWEEEDRLRNAAHTVPQEHGPDRRARHRDIAEELSDLGWRRARRTGTALPSAGDGVGAGTLTECFRSAPC